MGTKAFCGCCNEEVNDWNEHEKKPSHQNAVSSRLKSMAKDEKNPQLRAFYNELAHEVWIPIDARNIKLQLGCNASGCTSKEGMTVLEQDPNPLSYTCPDCKRSVLIIEAKIKTRMPKAVP